MRFDLAMHVSFCFLPLIALAACMAPAAPLPIATPAFAPTESPVVPSKPTTRLSPRLFTLASSPSLRAASPEEQARALSLPPQGPGSFMRDAQGRVLVRIRMVEVAPAQLQALRDSGAMITNVAEPLRTVTAYVALTDLMTIANVSGVENIQEELTPTGRGGGIVVPTIERNQ